MKKRKHLLITVVIFSLITFASCSKVINSKEVFKESNKSKVTAFSDKSNVKVKDKMKIKDYFMLLKISYDPMMEGYLSKDEKVELLNNKILKPEKHQEIIIKINELNDKEMEIQGESYDNEYLWSIKLFLNKNGNPLIGKELSYAQQNSIELYSYDLEKEELMLIASTDNGNKGLGILPEFNVNDFLAEEDAVSNTDGIPIIYYFEDDFTIGVEPYVWMNDEFENKEIKYRIHLKWNGEKFEIIKK